MNVPRLWNADQSTAHQAQIAPERRLLRQSRDFFAIHWEVHDHDASSIKLHVEAPSAATDEELNELKHRSLAGLLKRIEDLRRSVPVANARVELGKRLSTQAQRSNKST